MENFTYIHKKSFSLESGIVLPSITINYSTLGQLNEKKDNVIWVCHALTANADASNWWNGLVGAGHFFNPDEHFIICANVLGSCYGSTGPLEINPVNNRPYYLTFPTITIRDMVSAHEVLRDHLKIHSIHTCIGGSLGGQQALEWSIMKPEIIKNLVLLATNAFHSPWGIAFNEAQRMAIKSDSTWDKDTEHAGRDGLKAARAIALLSYRNYATYNKTQEETDIDKLDNYKASSYQNYQGEKLVNRFNCHSYLYLSKAMDSHQVGRGRGSVANALSLIKSKTLLIGIQSDMLFPVSEQLYLKHMIAHATYAEIDSLYGHDGFLIETKKIKALLENFYG